VRQFRKAFLLVGLALVGEVPLAAQRYHLRDGRVLEAGQVKLADGRLTVALVGDGAGEMAFPLSQVARLDWPEPAELARARRSLEAGRAQEAARLAADTADAFGPFARTEGSWWAEARALEARALLAAHRTKPARQAATSLLSANPPARVAAVARVVVAGADLRDGVAGRAVTVLEAELRAPDAGAEAEAAALLAEHRLATEDWEAALEAGLRVIVFHPGRADLLPGALLVSAKAYRQLGDNGRAERAALELVDRFPESAEGAEARKTILP
jgi:tetratricopeptide (TPR) repeat protein